jgi:hypothetical protein
MTDEVGSNGYFRGAGRRRYLQLGVAAALTVLAVAGILAVFVRPVLGERHVSVINHGHFQICRVTPEDAVICPPLSMSPSKSYSLSNSVSAGTGVKPPSLSKSFSASKSVSTSTSLLPPSTSTSLSPSVRTR